MNWTDEAIEVQLRSLDTGRAYGLTASEKMLEAALLELKRVRAILQTGDPAPADTMISTPNDVKSEFDNVASLQEAIKANLYVGDSVSITETSWIETVVTEDERTDDPVTLYAIRKEGKTDPVDYTTDIREAFNKAKEIGGTV